MFTQSTKVKTLIIEQLIKDKRTLKPEACRMPAQAVKIQQANMSSASQFCRVARSMSQCQDSAPTK